MFANATKNATRRSFSSAAIKKNPLIPVSTQGNPLLPLRIYFDGKW
jgi:hypothetical protein